MTILSFLGLRATRHVISWVVVLLLAGAILAAQDNLTTRGLRGLAGLLTVLSLAVYVHYWLLTHQLERGRYVCYGAGTAATLLLGGGLLYLAKHLVTVTLVDEAGQPAAVAYLYGQAVGNVFMALLLATVIRYLRRVFVSYFQLQQLRALQLETELSLLKAQVNQHFLFNTLNNLYGLSLAAPDQIPEALLQLADLMRYQLDSSRQRTVTVGTEAEYLANYIGLEKLRLRHNTRVEFTVDLTRPHQPLAPLLLLPLVENCFKHAIGPHSQNSIRIHLTQTDGGLILRTGNSIPPHFRPAPSGLGLPTLRARLAQHYPGARHRLDVKVSEDYYAATLQLVL